MTDIFSRFFAVFSSMQRCFSLDNVFGAFIGGVISLFFVVMLFIFLVRSFR